MTLGQFLSWYRWCCSLKSECQSCRNTCSPTNLPSPKGWSRFQVSVPRRTHSCWKIPSRLNIFSCAFPGYLGCWMAYHNIYISWYLSPFSHGSSCVGSICSIGHKSRDTIHTCRVSLPCAIFDGPSSWSSSWRPFHKTHRYPGVRGRWFLSELEDQRWHQGDPFEQERG